ncbi:MAG: MFS transporter [Ferruginibacter sp.]
MPTNQPFTLPTNQPASKRFTIVVLVNLVYFEVGLMVSIIGALIPDIIKAYGLSYSGAATLPVAYYVSFGLFAIPSGIVIEKFTYKKLLLFSYATAIIGIILFAFFRNYYSSIISLFIIGCALTLAQVLAFPLLRESVGARKLPFHSTLNTLLYGVGAFLSPYFYTLVIRGIANSSQDFPFNILHFLSRNSFPWAAIYWIFLALFLVTTLIIIVVKFPPVHLRETEKIGNLSSFKALLSKRHIYFYFFTLFAYAACEQGVSNWITQFLDTYHSVDPQTSGSFILSLYWLLFALGCMLGMVLLKYFETLNILLVFTLCAMISFCLAIFGSRELALWCFPLTGLFHSVMWPLILSLGINSVKKHHGSLSGLLFAASCGGAFGPMMVGRLGDLFGLRWGLFFLMICYSAVAGVYFWSRGNNYHELETDKLVAV